MKLFITRTIAQDVFTVKIEVQDVSQQDTELMVKFDEPDIDLGGSFTGPPAFTLPSRLVKVVSDAPHLQSFDADGDTEAEDKALVWQNEIVARITTAMTTLRANADTFSGEEIVNV